MISSDVFQELKFHQEVVQTIALDVIHCTVYYKPHHLSNTALT